ncbi:hypothetical protein [Streptomyces cadmiisoli]|uniref:hypothetical protein n=1 Tax=Streptomyces cadmiisoli TaxID=2184053 RepID=UPI0036622CE4
MRRWITWSVTAAVVLGVAGWIAEPYVRDWVLVRGACDGALPGDAVRQLARNGSHFTEAESVTHEELGEYGCVVTFEGDDVDHELLLRAEAYTRRDQQDREFLSTFREEGFAPQTALPEGLPGFVDGFGALQFVVPCPELGEDDDGRPRRMLVRTSFGRDALWGHPAVYETAVAVVNSASDRLGCGAEKLTAPEVDAGPQDPTDDPETVPLTGAGGTGCGWAARAGLPRPQQWRLADGTNDAAPTGRCELFSQGSAEDAGRVTLAAWYGDWSNRLTHDDNGRTRSLTATAKCAGEAANFALGADEIPGVGRAEQRALLKAFAEDQVRRRDCSDLRVTG